MRYLLGPDLLKAMGDSFDAKLIVETFKAHSIPITCHWVQEHNMDNECWRYVVKTLKWDPETTLIYYTPRSMLKELADDKNGEDRISRIIRTKSDDSVLCVFLENKTAEELITLLVKTAKMKAFI